MKQNNSSLPVFETDDDRSYLTVILPVQRSFLVQQETTKTRRTLPDIKKLILETLKRKKEASASDIAKELGYARITSTFIRALRELAESGRIAYTQPDKMRSRNQKLRLR